VARLQRLDDCHVPKVSKIFGVHAVCWCGERELTHTCALAACTRMPAAETSSRSCCKAGPGCTAETRQEINMMLSLSRPGGSGQGGTTWQLFP
jgi:hypothetical protein